MSESPESKEVPMCSRGLDLGLALSAGGARGAYQLGCWRAFLEKGVSFQAIAGSSIGALNGAFMCQGDWDKAYDVWIELTRIKIFTPDYGRIRKLAAVAMADLGLLFIPVPWRFLRYAKYVASVTKLFSRHGSVGRLRREGLLSIGALKPLIGNRLDMEAVRKSPISLFVTVTGPPGIRPPLGTARWFKLQSHSSEDAWKILGASMSIPFVFAAPDLDGTRYTDGGLGQWLPVEPLYQSGLRRVIAVSVKASAKVKESSFPGCSVTFINPERSMGRFPIATFRFTEDAVKSWIDRGYDDTMVALAGGAGT